MTVSGKKCFLDFSTRLVFLISKAFDRFLIFQDILVYVSPFFENLDYVSYKGVSYKPYWVYVLLKTKKFVRGIEVNIGPTALSDLYRADRAALESVCSEFTMSPLCPDP